MQSLSEREQARLGRLFLNAERFYWGVFEFKQRETYALLREKHGLDFKHGTYMDVTAHLLERPGILRLAQIAETHVFETVKEPMIEKLLSNWRRGELPSGRGFEGTINNARSPHFAGLLEVSTSFGRDSWTWHVSRWGDFAPIFFEDFLA